MSCNYKTSYELPILTKIILFIPSACPMFK